MFKIRQTTKFNLYCIASCPVIFCLSSGNSYNTPEERKLIEPIHSKNNNYLLMDRDYEDNKTLALDKTRRFCTID